MKKHKYFVLVEESESIPSPKIYEITSNVPLIEEQIENVLVDNNISFVDSTFQIVDAPIKIEA
jgi:hypothetical protein